MVRFHLYPFFKFGSSGLKPHVAFAKTLLWECGCKHNLPKMVPVVISFNTGLSLCVHVNTTKLQKTDLQFLWDMRGTRNFLTKIFFTRSIFHKERTSLVWRNSEFRLQHIHHTPTFVKGEYLAPVSHHWAIVPLFLILSLNKLVF